MKLQLVAVYICTILLSIFILTPFAWTVLTSMKTNKELITPVPTLDITSPWYYQYERLLFAGRTPEYSFPRIPLYALWIVPSMINSLITAISTTLICLLVGSLSAYSFSRYKFRGSNALLSMYLITRMIPSMVVIIPIYFIMNAIGATDSIIGLVIVEAATLVPYSILVLREYFGSISTELSDSARVDGASRMQTLWRIILPLSVPGLVVAGIFVFMSSWNMFQVALILTNSEKAIQMPVVISMFVTTESIDYGMMCAAAVLGGLPPMLLALVFQRYILSGLTSGAVKG